MAMPAEEKAAATIEKTRFDTLTDTGKAAEIAAQKAARPTLTITLSKGESKILTVTTKVRSNARAFALVAKENELTCTVAVEVKAREVKFKGV